MGRFAVSKTGKTPIWSSKAQCHPFAPGDLAGSLIARRRARIASVPFDLHRDADGLAGAGTSSNRISPTGTYTDNFDATRWLVSATLQGKWQYDAWTFSPRARFSYFQETSDAYVDSLGVPVPSVATSLGQIALGPGVSYRYFTDQGVALDFGLRLDGIFNIGDTSADGGGDFHGRAEVSVDASMPGGARLGLSVAQGGIGGNSADYLSGRLRVSTPLD